MNKYTALDAAIIAAIKAKPGIGFSAMLAGNPGREAIAHETDSRESFRVLDARLQALRKSGQIAFRRADRVVEAGWVEVKP